MRALTLAAAAAFMVGPALAQTGTPRSGPATDPSQSQRQELSALDAKCRQGDQQACREAGQLRAQGPTDRDTRTGGPGHSGSAAGGGSAGKGGSGSMSPSGPSR